ncbi:MAG: DUF393 domain-containing protein [Gemmatimonadales bacterium]|nr:DUF393 domain-containing protein [Gemmatimonadales bacterium]MYG50181.1 DUF393 domain-containing protein [Gemmatimonadales bacterium]MYK02603.1 DUF393 domain-containing protein [Candidatus Palauibacter ramosifaciens]
MNQAAGTGDRGPRTDDPSPEGPVVLFDGVCNLCAGAVRFIIRRDRRGRFRFAPLPSDAGHRILAATGVDTPGPDASPPEAGEPPESLVLVANGRAYARSGAALRIAAGLDRAWPLAAVLLVVPAPLRDLAYRLVARNRYRWFGRKTACELPPTEESWRFLDA